VSNTQDEVAEQLRSFLESTNLTAQQFVERYKLYPTVRFLAILEGHAEGITLYEIQRIMDALMQAGVDSPLIIKGRLK